MTQVWKRVHKRAGKFSSTPPPILKISNNIISRSAEVAGITARAFAAVSQQSSRPPEARRHMEEQEIRQLDFLSLYTDMYKDPFSMRELQSALTLCNDTSPGPDNIPFAMTVTQVLLLQLFNSVWHTGIISSEWRKTVVHSIYKPGKNGSQPYYFRPIALTFCLC